MKDFPFLAFSQRQDGVYWKQCWLFFHEGVGKGNHEIPGQLVTSCYRNWKNAREDFGNHTNKEYHKTCAEFVKKFLAVSSGKRSDIISLIDTQQTKEKKENRAAIIPIIKTILFCAEQELPPRGDHDSGPLSLIRPQINFGKFRAHLRFRIDSGDVNLEKHVVNHSKNAQYTSPNIQNEIIQVCSDIIIRKIIQKVNNAPICFTLFGDETMDISGTEQMSVCLRYLDFDEELRKLIIREDIVGFVPIYNQSSEKMTEALIREHAPESKKNRLIRLCETRFIERHESILSFLERFQIIHMRLEDISQKLGLFRKLRPAYLQHFRKTSCSSVF